MIAGLALAVDSANTVGFIEQTVDSESYSANVGVCFVPVGAASGSFTVSGNAFGTTIQDYDQFYAFDAENWDLTSYTYQGAADGWSILYADGSDAAAASLTIAPGTSLYYFGANSTFTVCGEVAASGSQSITFDPVTTGKYGFDFVNPFPVATTYGDLETFVSDYDQFYIFDAGNWDLESYTYQGASDGWSILYADGSDAAVKDSTAVFLSPGQSATYLPTAATTWTKTLNY